MKRNRNVEEWLRSYEIEKPKEEQIAECMKQIQQIRRVERIRRTESLSFLIETQVKFMKMEILFSFFLSIGALLLLQIAKSMLKLPYITNIADASIGISPFLAVPMIHSISKSRKEGMFELEACARHGIQRIMMIRTILNQALAIAFISFIWMINSMAMESFLMNRLFFSLISFETTAICFLWFGTSSIYRGACSAIGWMIMNWLFLTWKGSLFWVYQINSMVSGCAAVVLIGISMLAFVRYARTVSLESEELRWNFE